MPVSKELLEVLVCPVSRQRLREVDAAAVKVLLGRLKKGTLSRPEAADWAVEEISGFLATEDGKTVYPVLDDVPDLLPSSALRLE